MGHVDHGKTSLLDAIRETEVAAGEAGGITQHIGASEVHIDGRKVVFIDTPGHEAFTRMRARGAKVTDIVVLVVAADDGVMPQTQEAIDHAKAANVPIVVAINKIDKPEAQPERVKRQLSERGLMPEEWGGDTVMVEVSAKQKKNLDKLLEMLLLVADLRELKSNPKAPAAGTVLESRVDRGRGAVATILVQTGTLHTGDVFICGAVYGKVRAMFDDHGRTVKSAGPSTPVEVLGLQGAPEAGDQFQVTDEARARHIVEFRQGKLREATLARSAGARITLDQLHEQLKAGDVKELPLIIKADVQGSVEVLSEMLPKLSDDRVKLKIIHASIGAVTENDVLLASASGAIIVAFNVRPDRKATDLAQREGVEIRPHTVIYEVSDEIKKAMTGLLEPVFKETHLGRAEVRNTFRVKGVGTIAGCYVLDGVLKRDAEVRVLRDGVVIYTGRLSSLKRFKDDANEVRDRIRVRRQRLQFQRHQGGRRSGVLPHAKAHARGNFRLIMFRIPSPCSQGAVGAGMTMPIGLLTLEIYIPEAHSLKDKRQVLRSLKDRLRGKFNVAVAELDGQDSWQRSVVGVVSLSNNAGHVEQSLRTVLEESERHLGRDLVGHELEVL